MIELAIRDLKAEGLAHCPAGRVGANAAWALVAALAHNLVRWVAALGLGVRTAAVAETIRRRYLAVAGRITRSARQSRLHLPARWPWARGFLRALERLRGVALIRLSSPQDPLTLIVVGARGGDAIPKNGIERRSARAGARSRGSCGRCAPPHPPSHDLSRQCTDG